MEQELQETVEKMYRTIRKRHPMLTEHLDRTIRVRPVQGGGFKLVGYHCDEIFESYAAAGEARHGAIMRTLLEVERVYGNPDQQGK